jgi:hypothetical protein
MWRTSKELPVIKSAPKPRVVLVLPRPIYLGSLSGTSRLSFLLSGLSHRKILLTRRSAQRRRMRRTFVMSKGSVFYGELLVHLSEALVVRTWLWIITPPPPGKKKNSWLVWKLQYWHYDISFTMLMQSMTVWIQLDIRQVGNALYHQPITPWP